MELLRRYDAAEATKNRFLDQVLAWGKCDCLKMAAFCIGAIRGDKPLKGVLNYNTRAGALRAFRKAGYSSLAEAVDAYGLERIAPAMALPGDLIGIPTDDEAEGFGDYALAVMLASDAVIAFAEAQIEDRTERRASIGPLSVALSLIPAALGKPVIAWRAI